MLLIKYSIYRAYHLALKLASTLLPIPSPQVFLAHQIDEWVAAIKNDASQAEPSVLLITDKGIASLGLHQTLVAKLAGFGIKVSIFDEMPSDPDFAAIELATNAFKRANAEAIIALGGGSVIDGAKLVAVKLAKPNKSLGQLQGLFKVRKRLVPITAIPTTAGTGAETTLAAVVTDKIKQRKLAIVDLCMVPKYTLLLPELTCKLPHYLTHTTAMDALTHALEAYVSVNATAKTDALALVAAKSIMLNLEQVLADGNNVALREQLLIASHNAGKAFTRTSVGYVHAIAHQLGAKCHVPHGEANAVLLTKILAFYGDTINSRLANLQRYIFAEEGAEHSETELAARFMENLTNLVKLGNLPSSYSVINEQKLAQIVRDALAEAHPDYPVPKFMNKDECEHIVRSLMVPA
jgi:alcohol dehydrogenase